MATGIAKHVCIPYPTEVDTAASTFNPMTFTPSEDEIHELWRRHDLKHGDLVSFGNVTRYVPSFWVVNRVDESYIFQKNPDESGAGYVTITRQVLNTVPNALDFYADLLSKCPSVNLHLGRDDLWVRSNLGENVDVDVELLYEGGMLDLIVINGSKEFLPDQKHALTAYEPTKNR